MKITFSFPSRSRPVKFFAALDNIRSMSNSDNYEVIAKIDEDDKTFTDRFKQRLEQYPEVITMYGKSKNKIDAVNRSLHDMKGEILCLHSDDMVFIKRGFDEVIREAFKDFEGLLHFPDGFANERVCTYSIMHVNYYKRFGYIYHPDYRSLWCDDEQTRVAKMLNKYKYIPEQIFQHEHPVLGHVPRDDQYYRTEKLYREDQITFIRRQNMNFGL